MSDSPNFAPPRTMRDFNGNVGTVSYGMDSGMHAQFYIRPVLMEYLSETMGHPIFQDRIMIRIIAPGNTKTVWDYEAKGIAYDTAVDPDSGEYLTTWDPMEIMPNGEPTDMAKYPNAWAAFQKRGQQLETGFPIDEWATITRSFAESLKLMGVMTVEAMAQLSDANAANIMGGIKYRELAKAALSERKKNEIVSREQERASRAEEQVVQLQARLEQLEALMGQMAESNAAQGLASPIGAQGMKPPGGAKPKVGKAKQSQRTRDILAAAKGQQGGGSQAAA
jgi:hypothetical protein